MSEWIYNDRPAGTRFLPERIAEPGRTAIEDEIWSWIVRGEDDAGEFVDYLDDEQERHGATDGELAAAYDKALEVRRAQQRAWGDVHSNLNRAFAELNELGVLARENFSCCGTCAADFDEAAYDALSEDEQRARYQAGLERLLDETVFPVLREHGMRVRWDREQSTRVLVTGAQWYAPLD